MPPPTQGQLFDLISGAVFNVIDHHPEYGIDPRAAQSIAKRAAGAILARWPELLTAQVPSDRSDETSIRSRQTTRRGEANISASSRRRRQVRKGASSFKFLHNRLGNMAGEARKADQQERLQAIIEILRVIDDIRKGRVPRA